MNLFNRKQKIDKVEFLEKARQEEIQRCYQVDEQQKQKVAEYFKENPLKYNPGYKVFHWAVYKAEQYVYYWAGYGYLNNIGEMCNRYYIVNMKLGETRIVKEDFLDDLTNTYKKIRQKNPQKL